MTNTKTFKVGAAPCKDTKTRNWYAWNNLQPPKPFSFHMHGEVEVANPGVEPVLVRHNPQGINPGVLLLDLILLQKAGLWPDVLVWKDAPYDEVLSEKGYSGVDILCDGKVLVSVKVEDIH